MFRSQYDIKCSLIEDPIIKSTITAVAKSNVNDLRPVCNKGTVMTNTNIIHIYISKTNKIWGRYICSLNALSMVGIEKHSNSQQQVECNFSEERWGSDWVWYTLRDLICAPPYCYIKQQPAMLLMLHTSSLPVSYNKPKSGANAEKNFSLNRLCVS